MNIRRMVKMVLLHVPLTVPTSRHRSVQANLSMWVSMLNILFIILWTNIIPITPIILVPSRAKYLSISIMNRSRTGGRCMPVLVSEKTRPEIGALRMAGRNMDSLPACYFLISAYMARYITDMENHLLDITSKPITT